MERFSNNKLTDEAKARATKAGLFLPSDAEARNLVIIADAPVNRETAGKAGLTFADASEITCGKLREFQQERVAEEIEKLKTGDKMKLKRGGAERLRQMLEERETAKTAFLRSISGKPSTLTN